MSRHVCCFAVTVLTLVAAFSASPVRAIDILVDYRYDTNHFFDTNPGTTLNPGGATGAQQARDAIEAVAERYSSIITTSLDAVTVRDDSTDGRIGFSHPGTGASYEVSAAASRVADVLYSAGAGEADEYRNGMTFAADQWTLYAGARSLGVAGMGGTGSGTNFTTVFDDYHSHLNRGFNVGSDYLPVWGGAISFDNDGSTNWHFNVDAAAPSGKVDFYSIALHEVGHALGLNTTWEDFNRYVAGSSFEGPNAVAALNQDNGTLVTAVPLESTYNPHWNDNYGGGSYKSYIFAGGDPNLAGTVGLGVKQDLLMEPTAHFIYPSVRRFELTNIDVGALEDIGWEVIEGPSIPGDTNGDGNVDEADAETLADYWGQSGGPAQGDFNGDGIVGAADAAILAANWTNGPTESAAVPEPAGWVLALGCSLLALRRRWR